MTIKLLLEDIFLSDFEHIVRKSKREKGRKEGKEEK